MKTCNIKIQLNCDEGLTRDYIEDEFVYIGEITIDRMGKVPTYAFKNELTLDDSLQIEDVLDIKVTDETVELVDADNKDSAYDYIYNYIYDNYDISDVLDYDSPVYDFLDEYKVTYKYKAKIYYLYGYSQGDVVRLIKLNGKLTKKDIDFYTLLFFDCILYPVIEINDAVYHIDELGWEYNGYGFYFYIHREDFLERFLKEIVEKEHPECSEEFKNAIPHVLRYDKFDNTDNFNEPDEFDENVNVTNLSENNGDNNIRPEDLNHPIWRTLRIDPDEERYLIELWNELYDPHDPERFAKYFVQDAAYELEGLDANEPILRAIAEIADSYPEFLRIWHEPTPEEQRTVWHRAREIVEDENLPHDSLIWGYDSIDVDDPNFDEEIEKMTK